MRLALVLGALVVCASSAAAQHQHNVALPATGGAGYTAADTRFMQHMIGHHAQAIRMAALAPGHGASPALQRLAQKIDISQRDEIVMMKEWLAARKQVIPTDEQSLAMMMPGMLTDAQMRQLDAAQGKEFDRLFLTFMIGHHEGALQMVKELFSSPGAGQEPEIFRFATDVDADQRDEIYVMQRMLEELQDPLATRVDSVLSAFTGNVPGVQVAILRNGQTILERGYGLAQLEYGIRITPATVFHVASVSKQFTAFAIVLLAQQKKLSLDDDMRTHLPELASFPHKVTIRQLIHHTSGVRDQWELAQIAGWRMDDVITRDQIMSLMRRQRGINFAPGSEHLYSNMGYSLLAEIVERVSGQRFGDFLQEQVFKPLGMNSTHVHNDHQMVVPNRAYSYSPGPNGTWRNAVLSYANQGATSLFTTAADLARWLNNSETGQVGGRAAIEQMRERGVLARGETIPYAFAIVRGVQRGRVHWGHSGGDAGFRSYVTYYPAEKLGIAVLSNAGNVNAQAIASAVADLMFGEKAVAVQPVQQGQPQQPTSNVKVTAQELRAYVGDYYSAELGVVYTIEARGDTLFAGTRQGEARLNPVEKDVFRSGRTLTFERDSNGSVVGLKITGGRVRNLAFVRLKEGLPR